MKKFINITKICAFVMVAVLISTLVSGCSLRSTPAAPKTFVIWGFDDEDTWKPIIQNFKKELSGYQVTYVKKTFDDNYELNSLNAIISGQGPDLWAIPADWVYRHKDMLVPMPAAQAKTVNMDDQFVPLIKQMVYFDNNIYALSPTVDSLMLYWNEKLFQSTLDNFNNAHTGEGNIDARKKASALLSDAPSTWNNFVETSRLIKQISGANITVAGAAIGASNNIFRSTDLLYALMLQNGAKMTSDSLDLASFHLPSTTVSGGADTPGMRALSFYSNFSNINSPDYTWNSSMPGDADAFIQGRAGMMFGSDSFANYLAQVAPNFRYKRAPLPQIGDKDDNVVDFGTFTAFAVPALSKNQALAWTINQGLAIDMANQYATTLKVADSSKKKDFQVSLKDRAGETNPGKIEKMTATNWVKGRYPKEVDSIFKTIIDNVVSGKQTSQVALDNAASSVTELLRKTSW